MNLRIIGITSVFVALLALGIAGAAGSSINVSFGFNTTGIYNMSAGAYSSNINIDYINASDMLMPFPAIPQGFTYIASFYSTTSMPGIAAFTINAKYNVCDSPKYLVPFVLNYSWEPVNPYEDNSTNCYTSFSIPAGPTPVAIMYVASAQQPALQQPALQQPVVVPVVQQNLGKSITGYNIFGILLVGLTGLVGGMYMIQVSRANAGKKRSSRKKH
ncbi:MAG: hypothetical protein ACREBH_04485 [Candidatus Micrarchaeaceae archaeon]